MRRFMTRALAPLCALALPLTAAHPAASGGTVSQVSNLTARPSPNLAARGAAARPTSSPPERPLARGAAARPAGNSARPPAPSTLLLRAGDLPPGYASDGALENADATARTAAYARLLLATAFAGYRVRNGAVVQYVALARDKAAASLVVTHEEATVDHTRGAARITLDRRYGDGPALVYQQRGTRGETWVMAAFATGRYITVVGAYSGQGEGAAIGLLQRLAAVVAARLRRAARQAPDPPSAATMPALRIVALHTTTRAGRSRDRFPPRSLLYWRVTWLVAHPPRGARETVRARIWRGKRVLYHVALADMPFAGENAAGDHLQLGALAAGRYNVTVDITIGQLSATATHAFHITAPPGHKT